MYTHIHKCVCVCVCGDTSKICSALFLGRDRVFSLVSFSPLTGNGNAALRVLDFSLPGTVMHVDIFGLEKVNRDHLQDVKDQSFFPKRRRPEIFIAFILQPANQRGKKECLKEFLILSTSTSKVVL